MQPAVELPMVTTSERTSFKRCPQQWWWAYREGLRANTMNDKLWFGIGIHEALASLYLKGTRRNKKFMDTWQRFCDEDEISISVRTRPNGQVDESLWVEARALGVAMLQGYVDLYDWDRNWDVIYTEEPFQILIPNPRDASSDVAVFASTFDGVYRDTDTGYIWLMEHKTAASISTGHLPMDDQGGSYWAVATHVLRDKGVLGKGERINGITYNFLRKSLPSDKPRDAEGYTLNLNGSRSKVQPAPLFMREQVIRTRRELRSQVARIGHEVLVMNEMRDGTVEPWKTPTRDCAWGCAFYNMCQLHEQQADWAEFRDALFVVRDPYDRYKLRKTASEIT